MKRSLKFDVAAALLTSLLLSSRTRDELIDEAMSVRRPSVGWLLVVVAVTAIAVFISADDRCDWQFLAGV